MIRELLYEEIACKGIDLVERQINRLYLENKRFKLWENAFIKVAKYSEMLSKDFSIELSKHRTLRRFFYLTFDTSVKRFPVESFIISLAMEFKDYGIKLEHKDIISIGEALVQMWRKEILGSTEANANTCFINNDMYIYKDSLISIINNREQIIRNFYKDLEDENGLDRMRVYYPEPGKTWIEWKEEYSIDICVNMCKGIPLGFTRIGYDYFILKGDELKHLKLSYLSEDKTCEIMRVHTSECPDDKESLIWVY